VHGLCENGAQIKRLIIKGAAKPPNEAAGVDFSSISIFNQQKAADASAIAPEKSETQHNESKIASLNHHDKSFRPSCGEK
jgi:hypothetical protein